MGLVFKLLEVEPVEQEIEVTENEIKNIDGKDTTIEVTKTKKIKVKLEVNKLLLPYQSPYLDYEHYDELKKQLASRLGIDLKTMAGYGGQNKWNAANLKDTPLIPLLSKLGYEHEYTPEQCKEMSIHVRSLGANIEDLYIRKQTELLAEMMKIAGDNNKVLKLC